MSAALRKVQPKKLSKGRGGPSFPNISIAFEVLSFAIDLGISMELLNELSVPDLHAFADYRDRRADWAEKQRKKKSKAGDIVDVGAIIRKGGGDL